jgi:hypothetical protein
LFKKKQERKGTLFGEFLLFQKEVFPYYINKGRRKERKGFFKCKDHGFYFELTHRQARLNGKTSCPCTHRSSNYKPVPEKTVNSYSYLKDSRDHKDMLKFCHPSWFRVTRMGIFLDRKDGTTFRHYKFSDSGKKGEDYQAAKHIETMLWNRKGSRNISKALILSNFSRKLEKIIYKDDFYIPDKTRPDEWGWGAKKIYFEEYIKRNNIL